MAKRKKKRDSLIPRKHPYLDQQMRGLVREIEAAEKRLQNAYCHWLSIMVYTKMDEIPMPDFGEVLQFEIQHPLARLWHDILETDVQEADTPEQIHARIMAEIEAEQQ